MRARTVVSGLFIHTDCHRYIQGHVQYGFSENVGRYCIYHCTERHV